MLWAMIYCEAYLQQVLKVFLCLESIFNYHHLLIIAFASFKWINKSIYTAYSRQQTPGQTWKDLRWLKRMSSLFSVFCQGSRLLWRKMAVVQKYADIFIRLIKIRALFLTPYAFVNVFNCN